MSSDNDDIVFIAEDADAAENWPSTQRDPWRILIVDDDPDVHEATRFTLADTQILNRPLQLLHAYSGTEALALLREHQDIAVILLDVVMESDDAGLRTVDTIRNDLKLHNTRIVLRTGQPGQAPERQVTMEYDINDYKEKTELTAQKLFTTMVASLRAYRDLRTIEHHKQGLAQLVAAAQQQAHLHAQHAQVQNNLADLQAMLNRMLQPLGLHIKNWQDPAQALLQLRVFADDFEVQYRAMLLRDLQRFEDATARMDAQCPLGSGALAGTTYPLDRQFTAEKLGFAAPCANSLDGVSDRDFCIELANAISICMMHLSRLSEEIILWCSWEFKFIELDDAFTTGSSIMPQKKNPDVTELIRGKTGRVYGDLNTLLVMMKGLPLAYNKDMQEDKEAIFDAVDTLELCLKTITPMLDTMKTLPANMRRAAAKGFINATDCADYLTKKGMPFRDAYKLTGCMVSDCIAKDKTLEELTLDEFKGYSALFENDIYDAIDLIKCCEGRTSYGGPSEASVKKQIELASAQLGTWEAANA